MIMKYYIYLYAIFFIYSCKAQETKKKECDCELSSYTLSDPNISANLYLKKGGFRVMTLSYPYGDKNEECIFTFDITSCDNGWLKVKSPNSLGKYWIEPERLATTSSISNFKLYSSINKGNVVFLSNRKEVLTIVGCKGKWAKVFFTSEAGKRIEGWISPKEQCANPYTNCN